jgi:hypothetical protein
MGKPRRFTDDEIEAIRIRIRNGEKQKDIATEMGVYPSSLSAWCRMGRKEHNLPGEFLKAILDDCSRKELIDVLAYVNKRIIADNDVKYEDI